MNEQHHVHVIIMAPLRIFLNSTCSLLC